MSSPVGTERSILVLLFDRLNGQDSLLWEHLEKLGFDLKFVGVERRAETAYSFLVPVEGGAPGHEADITLDEALKIPSFDVLIIPGGLGARRVITLGDRVIESIGKLIDTANVVLGSSLGSIVIASTGRLNRKMATTDRAWSTGGFLRSWPDVNWQPESYLIQHGKFVTVNTIIRRTVTKVADALLSAMAIAAPPGQETDPPTDPNPAPRVLPDDGSPWHTLLNRIHATAQRRVASDGVSVSEEMLQADPFLRSPATHDHIRDAETQVGQPLPDDYKAFLRVSDGTGFSGCTDIPSLVRVADLSWSDANELGFESLRLEVPPAGQPTALPYERVLQISDADEDTVVCFVEPAFVERAAGTVNPQMPTSEWIIFEFIPWMASYRQFKSFTSYMESKADPQAVEA